MALDEPNEDNVKGVTFTIEKGLYDEAKPIGVDFVESPTGSGFQLKSNLPSSGCC